MENNTNNNVNSNEAYNGYTAPEQQVNTAPAENPYANMQAFSVDSVYGANPSVGTNTQPTGNMGNPIIENSNRTLGIIGAIGGALIGGAAWVLVGYLGYIVGYLAILIYFLAVTGYKKLGKKEDTFGYVFCGILVLVVVTLATYLYFGLWLTNELKDIGKNVTIGRVFGNMKWFLNNYDLWGSFIKNLVMGYLFSIAATVGMLVSHIKEVKNK